MTTISSYDSIIGEFLSSSEPTAREVCEAFLSRHRGVVSKYGKVLAERQIRTMISDRMKKAVQNNANTQQHFDFGIENVPNAITFEDGAEFRYISIHRATDRHLAAYCKLLEGQIAADGERLSSIIDLRRKLARVFKQHPGITVGQAMKKLRKEAA